MNTLSILTAFGFIVLLLLSVISIICVTVAKAQEMDRMFAVASSPYGISFQEWTQKWWQWYLKIPKQNNHNYYKLPGYKAVDCSYLQDPNSPVFFVPYVLRDKGQPDAEATCNIPPNKAVMIGIDNGLMDYGDSTVQPKTVDKLVELVKKSNAHPNEFKMTLDGNSLPLIAEDKDRVLSKPFYINLPDNNVWNEKPHTEFLAVADGWYLMLKPLSPGTHVLSYQTGYDIKLNEKGGYIQHVTYKFVVKPQNP